MRLQCVGRPCVDFTSHAAQPPRPVHEPQTHGLACPRTYIRVKASIINDGEDSSAYLVIEDYLVGELPHESTFKMGEKCFQ